MDPQIQFLNQTGTNIFSFKHQEHCFLRVLRNYADQKLQDFYRVCHNFWTIYGSFSFFNYSIHNHVGPSKKCPILNAGASEKIFIVDHLKEVHNEREFKH